VISFAHERAKMIPAKLSSANPLRTSGFSLIEVLIALVVFSVGLLGVAGLQVSGLRANHSSALRSQTTYLAYDMADRMRANLQGVNDGNYNNLSGVPGDPGCVSSGCTPALMAQDDLREWNLANSTNLPSGSGAVCLDSTPNDGTPTAIACDGLGTAYAIKIWWSDDKSGTPKLFAMSFKP
jgi:type IV pilus assembly protein PilV